MGSTLATELAEGDFGLDLRAQITIQLRNNHYPPVPYEMVDPCIDAITACNEGNYSASIALPSPIMWRGQDHAPASAIVEAHHLDPWIDQEE